MPQSSLPEKERVQKVLALFSELSPQEAAEAFSRISEIFLKKTKEYLVVTQKPRNPQQSTEQL